ncbi:uncharacterized protein MYCFIDRAFT_212486 [Pseudocercospora fijiensis CIRAD86]|uniref:Large ribosomal subunit protein uL23m n=1 Tax=Pseudocercospora fijiensis (strain CIRAD86) TaxID=383855 RepID=M2YMA8_PSEFD|nr:uncharacterized protein MYCFIDRAFT_212486 [Pseudocercospora fijiensis CIRAD86]EME78870.1 hypothetical protein MYCFIDRAFT_212486 [Pseudocercospora fijiensis CIRAD86]
MATASFRVGKKELFIPNVNIAFIRGRLPHEARFQVPLWFSKLDLRDYLWHAYQVEILRVRSYVKQSRVQSGKPHEIRPSVRRWHRPKAKKYMTVSLVRPFVWPERSEDHEEWNRKEVKAGDEETRKMQEKLGSMSDAMVNEERRERMKEQAKALLEGKAKWKAPDERSRYNTSFLRGQ